jgi:Succinylglutamate desuccinylase / Aspartoacylase family
MSENPDSIGKDEYLAALESIDTYKEDGRASLFELNKQYDELESKYRFAKEPVYTINVDSKNGPVEVTVYCYKSAKKGPALWILSGVHGEEPTGPNAIAQNIDTLGELGREVPLVIIPLLNPKGYSKDDRYYDEHRDFNKGHSVGDSEHYLPSLTDPDQPRVATPSSGFAAKVTRFVLDTIANYPPILTADFHEDELLNSSYVYSQGPKGAEDEVAQKVISILEESGIPLKKDGPTRFGEPIKKGVVIDDENGKPIQDGSVDELLGTANKIIVDGKIVEKPIARTSLVIETPTINVPLEKRIKAHSNILKQLKTLWELANR